MPKGIYPRTEEMKTGKYKRTEYHREICRRCNTFKKGFTSWNKGTHIQTNTGRTHFKKGVKFSKKTIKQSANSRRGKVYHLRKNGRIKMAKGYIGIYMPSHPFAYHKHRYVPEHRLVIEKYLGRYLKPFERVHHINKIKNDNRPKNLMAFKNDIFHRRFEKGIEISPDTIIFDGRKFSHSPVSP